MSLWPILVSTDPEARNISKADNGMTLTQSKSNEKQRLEMSHSSSNNGNDPRQPSAARPFRAPSISQQDLPMDYSGFIAVIFGLAGAMFRYKMSSWMAIIFCAQSLANMRNMENDLKQISMAMMFAIMGLVTNYVGSARPQK